MLNALEGPEFPECTHASGEVGGRLRKCLHPGLLGLKSVTAGICSACYYRASPALDEAKADERNRTSDHAIQRLWDCAYLNPSVAENGSSHHASASANQRLQSVPNGTHQPSRSGAWLDMKVECRHPDHESTTRRACDGCSDYLFPQFSPRMPVDDVRRLLTIQNHPQPANWWLWPNVQTAFRELVDRAIPAIIDNATEKQNRWSGRGIVIAGGGRYFPSAYVTIRVLRHVGCDLPIQLWHLENEIDQFSRSLLQPLNVECVNGEQIAGRNGHTFHKSWWKGWQLKPYSILHSPFQEVLYLDADSYPTRNPEFLFDWADYRRTGAVFWPDIDGSAILLPPDRPPIFGVEPFQDRPTESGQLLIHKGKCWRELNLAWIYNHYAEFTYRTLWGDKDTFPIAWKKLGSPYARMWPTASSNAQAVLQYDDAGCLLFQHRATDKFRIPGAYFDSTIQSPGANQHNPEMIHEDFCFGALAELREALAEASQDSAISQDTLKPIRLTETNSISRG